MTLGYETLMDHINQISHIDVAVLTNSDLSHTQDNFEVIPILWEQLQILRIQKYAIRESFFNEIFCFLLIRIVYRFKEISPLWTNTIPRKSSIVNDAYVSHLTYINRCCNTHSTIILHLFSSKYLK